MRKPREQILFRQIFHPSDFSEASYVAFAHALKLAVAARSHLTILHTGSKATAGTWAEFPRVRQTLENWSLLPPGSTKDDIGRLGLDIEKVVLSYSDPARSIVRYLCRHPHDLIVLATHQYDGLKRWVHEPVAGPVARDSAEVTLFVPHNGVGFIAPADGSIRLQNILIPVASIPDPGLSIAGTAALVETLELGRATATLLHIGKEETFPECTVRETPAVAWRRVCRRGHPEEEILKSAEETHADVIVMSTQGHRGFLDAIRGSTAERVVRGAKCPVLVLPDYAVLEPRDSTLEALAVGKLAVGL
jgi:nucleotide-binding universal stress UspA family protein